MKRVLVLCVAAAALSVATAPTAFAVGDAGSGNQPKNANACAAINQASDHTPGAANGQAMGDLLVAFCSP